jgi:hypothetical protein
MVPAGTMVPAGFTPFVGVESLDGVAIGGGRFFRLCAATFAQLRHLFHHCNQMSDEAGIPARDAAGQRRENLRLKEDERAVLGW